jgi:hypothetical protein
VCVLLLKISDNVFEWSQFVPVKQKLHVMLVSVRLASISVIHFIRLLMKLRKLGMSIMSMEVTLH